MVKVSWVRTPENWGLTTSERRTGVRRSAKPMSASATQAKRRVTPTRSAYHKYPRVNPWISMPVTFLFAIEQYMATI